MKTLKFLPWSLWLAATAAMIHAQPALRFNAIYQCPRDFRFRVRSCTGSSGADVCDVDSQMPGQVMQHDKFTRLHVMNMVSACHLLNPAAPGAPQASSAGIQVGDEVEVVTAGGWMNARVLAINGNSYRVRAANGGEVWKTYPTELRRIGPATAQDHANGQYRAGERVQVLFQGRWIESKILVEMGQEYQVELPGNRAAWTTAQNVRPSAIVPPAPPRAGTPPKPGMTSCAGKIEGRYAAPGLGGFQITFRSGKATMSYMGGDEELECWMSGGRIYLHKPGETNDMPIDINDDGTLQTPMMGELRKKGN